MRSRTGIQLCGALALFVAPVVAHAQATAADGDAPNPSAGGIDVQAPHPRILLSGGLAAGNEYRDRLLSDRATVSASVNIAWKGFSFSAWGVQELATRNNGYEVVAGYSHKFPWIDVHAALVSCGNRRLPGGCADGARLTITSNSIRDTTLEASYDQAFGSSRRTWSLAATRDIWKNDLYSTAGRVAWTRTDYGAKAYLEGVSLRLIAARRLGPNLELDAAAGPVWNAGRVTPPSAHDGVFASLSLVWRY